MSVEAHDLVGDEWTRWQGHLVKGVFPLGRPLGGSEHSGVFLTNSAAAHRGEAAIKLLPATRGQEELQLSRWQLASGLVHPNLLPLREWGACQLDGLPFLYLVMDYAEQTLAHLLQRRALTGDEARAMLTPMLKALAFLHPQGLVHGGLKPTNILVVGDELKLASDTIRRVGEETLVAPSAHGQPKGLAGSISAAGDMQALGLSLVEALTRRPSQGSVGQRGSVTLPADFAPDFGDIVTRCLSPIPENRPSVTVMLAWAAGGSAEAGPHPIIHPTTPDAADPKKAETAAPISATLPARPPPEATPAMRHRGKSSNPRPLVAMIVAAMFIAAVGGGVRSLRGHGSTDVLPIDTTVVLMDPMSFANASSPSQSRTDVPSTRAPSDSDVTQTLASHAVIPAIPKHAARTISGHVEVAVRATVRPDGSVSSVAVDRGGRSQYFKRLAVQAAKKWTFQPVPEASSRVVQIQFVFGRDGAVAHSAALQ